jgi:hypothetical protein
MVTRCRSDSIASKCSRAIALNNEGATSLAFGDIALAISTFCQALHTSKLCQGRRIERVREGQDWDSYCSLTHRNYTENENREETHRHHSGIEQQDLPSLSPTLPHFDIGRLMEADCFGLSADEENTEPNLGTDSSSSTIKKSFSLSSACSDIRQPKCKERNRNVPAIGLACDDFIYRKPIRIPESYAHHAKLQRSEIILPSIVIFNLALAHHIWAMKMENKLQKDVATGTNSLHEQRSPSLLLKKSATLYGLAIRLQEGQVAEEGPQSYSKLFFLSCINNLGNTHRLLGDMAASEKIYQQLLAMLMYLNYSEQERGYELSTTDTTTSVSNTSSSSTQSLSTSTFSAGRTYGSFFRNIFRSEVKVAPAA